MLKTAHKADELLAHLRRQRELLESGDWQQAVEREGTFDLRAAFDALTVAADEISMETRREIAVEIGKIIALSETLRDSARESFTSATPHQRHLQRLLRDLGPGHSRVIAEA